MVRKVFILGNHIQALGLVRQINDLGISAFLFSTSKFSVASFSNAVNKHFVFNSQEHLLRMIIDKVEKKEKEILLFPTNDEMVDFLAKNYNELKDSFYLGIPEPINVEIFYCKRETYLFAKQNNIPTPKTWIIETIEKLKDDSLGFAYPVVIKPTIMHMFHKTFGKKAYKCENRYELLEKAIQIEEKFPLKNLIIQEFIEGGGQSLFSYGTYSYKGKPVASIIVNRIRQNPMVFGNSTTFAKTCYIPKIKDLAEKILSITNYSGFAEIEFMFDKITGEYKFLEINPRAWKWHTISNVLGFSFIEKMICIINNKECPRVLDFDKEVAWVDRLTDFSVIFKEILKFRINIISVIKSYKITKEYAVWSKNDIKPFIMYLLLSPILYFTRH